MSVRAKQTPTTLRKLERVLTVVLLLTVLDTAYLSWRFIALHAGWVASGTGLCSWTAFVDCDKVLMTEQARAFYVPNAILGFGFFFGCLVWWTLGRKLGSAYRYHIIRTLVFWLALATLFTFRFFWLLFHLKAFCPFCPWNHLLTYVALFAAWFIWWVTPHTREPMPLRPLVGLVCLCVAQFWVWQVLWMIAYWKGMN